MATAILLIVSHLGVALIFEWFGFWRGRTEEVWCNHYKARAHWTDWGKMPSWSRHEKEKSLTPPTS